MSRALASFVWFPICAVALVWGCAQGGFDGTSTVDPTLPDAAPSEASSKQAGGDGSSPTSSNGGPSSTSPPPGGDPPVDAGVDAGDAGSKPPPPGGGGPATKPKQGEVLISEVMFDPSGTEPVSEWFEVYNASSGARTLSGLTIVDGGNRTHVIGAGVTVDAGAYVVLVRNKSAASTAKIPSGAIVYDYGAGLADTVGIQLANGATGGLELDDGATTIAQAIYGGWFSASSGASIQLKTLSFNGSSQSSGWCTSSATWTSGSDKGTPGAAGDCK